MTTKDEHYYDSHANDDTAHVHVRQAREAGRAWAEREAATCEALAESAGSWYPTDADAIPLVSFAPDSTVEDQIEREAELAAICNAAAAERWEEIVDEAMDDEDLGIWLG